MKAQGGGDGFDREGRHGQVDGGLNRCFQVDAFGDDLFDRCGQRWPAAGDAVHLVNFKVGPVIQANIARVANIVEELGEDARFVGRATGEKLDELIAAAVVTADEIGVRRLAWMD